LSKSERGAGAAVGTIIAFLGLIVAVLQLVHDVYGVGPAPITYVLDQIKGSDEGEGPGTPPGSGLGPGPTDAFDFEPPTVPQNLRISTSTRTRTGCDVVLAWQASTDNTGVESYPVYANGTYRGSAPGNSSTFAVSIFVGKQENFTISASDGSNESGQSNAVAVSC
jgi:hypothetical protein